MVKRKGGRQAKARRAAGRAGGSRKSVSRPSATKRKTGRSVKKTAARPARKTGAKKTTTRLGKPPRAGQTSRTKAPRLDRARRQLEETVPTPPSSLDMDRHGSAARTGRAELAEQLQEHPGITPAIAGGDVDADWESAYYTGDEAPGGDNPTPDQEVVDDIGRSLGVEYQDNEELKSSDKVAERDKHRWELDPASSEDYKERD